jgi:hypothetical protein
MLANDEIDALTGFSTRDIVEAEMSSLSLDADGRGFRFLAACAFAIALLSPEVAMARAGGPFAALAGEWRGAGSVTGSDGRSERLACRADNRVSGDGFNLSQSLVCASDSYRFDIRTDISTDGRTVHGTWQEATRNAAGNLDGEIRGNSIQGTVEGQNFTAAVSLTTSGNRMQVIIVPQGTDLARIEVGLRRGG